MTDENIEAIATADVEVTLEKFLSANAPNITEAGMVPHVFTNDKTDPSLFGILDMLYAGVLNNSLGIMSAKHRKTGMQAAMIVGVDGDSVYPIAMAIGAERINEFMAPDGEGGWVDFTSQ